MSTAGLPKTARGRLVRSAGFGLCGLAVVVAAWQLTYWLWNPGAAIFPSVQDVFNALRADRTALASATLVTGYEVLLGFALAALLGVTIGAAMHVYPRFRRVALPAILVMQVTPLVALAPILIIWFGISLLPKVILVAVVAFFPLAVSADAGFRSLDRDVAELASSIGVGRSRFFSNFELPSALPQIFTGAKIAMSYAVIGAVVAEFFAASGGLGTAILIATGTLNTASAIAALVVLSALGLVLYWSVGALERVLIPWHVARRHVLQPGIGLARAI